MGLKAIYRKKQREKINEYNRKYKSQGKKPLKKQQKEKIKNFYGNKCQRCFESKNLNVHHIKPARFGGTNSMNNLLVLCWHCHMEWEKRMRGYWKKIYKVLKI